jgi:hypothetical protein
MGLAACGGGSGGGKAQTKPVALAIIDNTSSFDKFAAGCTTDFLTVAQGVAARRGHLYAGALLTGDPFSQTFTVDTDFNRGAPSAIQGNADLEASYRKRQAERLRPAFKRMAKTKAAVGGSPVFTTLERASTFRTQRAQGLPFWLVVCSDLADVGDGLDVRKPISNADVAHAVKRFTPQLEGLKGADLYFISAGRLEPGSTVRPESIRQIERVLREVARKVGANLRLIDTQLGTTFPLGGQ